MNNIFETIVVALTLLGAGSFFIWIFSGLIYMTFIEDKLRAKRKAKARKLYPNYYFWANKRDEHLNLKHGYFREAYKIKENIDKILAEKPYLPNNMLVPTEESGTRHIPETRSPGSDKAQRKGVGNYPLFCTEKGGRFLERNNLCRQNAHPGFAGPGSVP